MKKSLLVFFAKRFNLCEAGEIEAEFPGKDDLTMPEMFAFISSKNPSPNLVTEWLDFLWYGTDATILPYIPIIEGEFIVKKINLKCIDLTSAKYMSRGDAQEDGIISKTMKVIPAGSQIDRSQKYVIIPNINLICTVKDLEKYDPQVFPAYTLIINDHAR